MVLAAGLTSRREPASHSRRLVELAIAGFANVASAFIRDSQIEHEHLTDDPDDDYLADAALKTGAFLVTRDDAANFGKVEGSGWAGPARRFG